MHPEIESYIRQHAGDFVDDMERSNRMFTDALDGGVVNRDDIYFLGIVDGAGSVSLQFLVDAGMAPVSEGTIVQDDPEFRARESERQYSLTAELYDCSAEAAEDRWNEIMARISAHWNARLRN